MYVDNTCGYEIISFDRSGIDNLKIRMILSYLANTSQGAALSRITVPMPLDFLMP